jgi:hypothetical protein
MGLFDEIQKTIFFQNDPQSASGQQMRQKIALAMLMKKQTAPKTFGEGLYSIGDSLGDAFMGRQLERQAAEQAARTDKDIATDATRVSVAAPAPPVAPGPAPAAVGPRSDLGVPAAEDVADASAAAPAAAAPAALAGFRPAPAYLAPHLAASGLSPERQAYLGHLAGKEARSANEVSPTGAAGPFQFIRSTGRQYGLVGPDGDRRTDPVASIAAVNRLTDDNAAALEKALGRPPSPGELALAHQQGAGTAAKMLSGTGNAPNYNLAVNNAGGLGPQAAAQKIMGYYGMPGSGGPRDNAAAVLASRTADTPLTPADTAQEQRLGDVTGMTRAPPSFGATASNRTGDVMSDLPPVTGALQGPLGQSVGDTVQQRQQAVLPPPQDAPPPPGPQLAQGGPFPPVASAGGQPQAIIPGGGLPPQVAPQIPAAPPDPRAAIRTAPRLPDEYVPPEKDPQPEPPAKPGVGPVEQQLTRDVLNRDVDPRRKEAAARIIEAERARLMIPYENQVLKYKADIANWQKRQEQVLGYRMGLPKQRAETESQYASTGKTQQELSDMQEKSALQSRFGGRDPEKFFTEFDKEKEAAAKTVHAVNQYATVRDMIGKGIIVGTGQGLKVSAAKVAAAFGYKSAADAVSHTEQLQAALTSTLGLAIDNIQGSGQKVSDSDLKVARGTIGDPEQQLQTIKDITQRAEKIARGKLNEYEDQRDYYFGGAPRAERRYQLPVPETAPQPHIDALLKNKGDDAVKAEFDQRFGPGAADLEIARAKRRERRGN